MPHRADLFSNFNQCSCLLFRPRTSPATVQSARVAFSFVSRTDICVRMWLLLHGTRVLRDYRTVPSAISLMEAAPTRLSRPIDHLAIDASGFVGGAIRLVKEAVEPQRRDREIARIVGGQITATIRRLQPQRSVAILLDGSDPLWKAARVRAGPSGTKKAEGRTLRLPGSTLMTVVEEKVLETAADRRTVPAEVVVSTSLAPGMVELKMAAWCREIHPRRHEDQDGGAGADGGGGGGGGGGGTPGRRLSTVAFVGANELFLTVWASMASWPPPDGVLSSGGGSGGVRSRGARDESTTTSYDAEETATALAEATSVFVQSNNDFKTVSGATLRHWLARGVTPAAAATAATSDLSSTASASSLPSLQMMSDLLFLKLLCHGHSAADLPSIGALSFASLADAYYAVVAAAGGDESQEWWPAQLSDSRWGMANGRRDGHAPFPLAVAAEGGSRIRGEGPHMACGGALVRWSPEGGLQYCPAAWLRLLDVAKSGTGGVVPVALRSLTGQHPPAAFDANAADYISMLSLVWCMLTVGFTPPAAASFVPWALALPASSSVHWCPTPGQLSAHLRWLSLLGGSGCQGAAYAYVDAVPSGGEGSTQPGGGTSEDESTAEPIAFDRVADETAADRGDGARAGHSPAGAGGLLTAAEYSLMTCTNSTQFAAMATEFVGQQVDLGAAHRIVSLRSPADALAEVRCLLRLSNPLNQHRCVAASPSLCMVEDPAHKAWRLWSIDL